MKLLASFFLFCISMTGQTGSVSATIEPALKSPAQFGVSAAVSLNLTENNWASLRYGHGSVLSTSAPSSAVLAGVGRNLVNFMPGAVLAADIQAGWAYAAGRRNTAILYGAGVVTDVGNDFTVTYGLHVNKVHGAPMYPSLYVSIAKIF